MNVISTKELKNKLDNGKKVRLLMTYSKEMYDQMHIPGSEHYERNACQFLETLGEDEEVIVYCTNPLCFASIQAYKELKSLGVDKIRRYAGGLMDWQSAGYSLAAA